MLDHPAAEMHEPSFACHEQRRPPRCTVVLRLQLLLLALAWVTRVSQSQAVVYVNGTFHTLSNSDPKPGAAGLRVIGSSLSNAVWYADTVLPAGIEGSLSLEHLTLVGTRVADPLVQPFGLPDLLQLAQGVPLQLLDVRIVAPSCDTLLAYQQAACAAQPSAAQEVGAGWLFTHELVAGTVTVSGVNLTCAADTAQLLAQPPCFASAVRSGDALMQALRGLAAPSDAGERPPAFLTTLSNISLSLDSVGPSNSARVPITRNVTIAGAAYNATAAAATFGANGASPLYRALMLRQLYGLDLALRPGVFAVQPPYGRLVLAGLVLENAPLNVTAGAVMPSSINSMNMWSASTTSPGQLHIMDCVQVEFEDEFEYWAYYITLAGSADEALRAQSAWLSNALPSLRYNPDSGVTSITNITTWRIQLTRTMYQRVPLVVPRAGPARSGIGAIVPGQHIPIVELGGVASCLELLAALQANSTAYRGVLLLQADISLAEGVLGGCPRGAWPAGGLTLNRSVALVGDVGRAFSVLDLGLRVGALRIVQDDVRLTLKGVVVVNAPMAAPSEQAARPTNMGLLTHLLWFVDHARPKVHIQLYNTTIEVPEQEVRLLLPLALDQPAPPNTLPREQILLFGAMLTRSTVANWSTTVPPDTQQQAANAFMTMSEIFVPGIRGYNVTLSTNATALLAADGGRPFPRLPLAVSYLGGPGAQPEGVEADAGSSSGGGGGSGGLSPSVIAAIVVPSVIGALLLASLGLLAIRSRRHQRPAAAAKAAEAAQAAAAAAAGAEASGYSWEKPEGMFPVNTTAAGYTAAYSSRQSHESCSLCPGQQQQQRPNTGGHTQVSVDSNLQNHSGSLAVLMPAGGVLMRISAPDRDSRSTSAPPTAVVAGAETCSTGVGSVSTSSKERTAHEPHAAFATGSGPASGAPNARPTSMDSFDQPPSEYEGLGTDGERPAAEELAAMVATLRDEMMAAGEELVIAEVLGSGAFGVVYRGAWKGLDVAVKTLRFGDRLYGDERHRKAALKEAAICCSLHHPNVVTTYAYDIKPVRTTTLPAHADDLPAPGSGGNNLRIAREPDVREWKLYLIQEYCAGGTLRQLVDRGAMTLGGLGPRRASTPALPRIVATALEVASGMCHIHAKNIVHADLNPNNVLLQHTSAPAQQPLTAKIADFGLSMKFSPDQTHMSNARHGTLHYMAPEVLAKGQMTKAADVYSFGVILWELAHGTPPWRQANGAPRTAGQKGVASAATLQHGSPADASALLPPEQLPPPPPACVAVPLPPQQQGMAEPGCVAAADTAADASSSRLSARLDSSWMVAASPLQTALQQQAEEKGAEPAAAAHGPAVAAAAKGNAAAASPLAGHVNLRKNASSSALNDTSAGCALMWGEPSVAQHRPPIVGMIITVDPTVGTTVGTTAMIDYNAVVAGSATAHAVAAMKAAAAAAEATAAEADAAEAAAVEADAAEAAAAEADAAEAAAAEADAAAAAAELDHVEALTPFNAEAASVAEASADASSSTAMHMSTDHQHSNSIGMASPCAAALVADGATSLDAATPTAAAADAAAAPASSPAFPQQAQPQRTAAARPPPRRMPSLVVSATQLLWSTKLPPAYVSLGHACLSSHPEQRPTFPTVVRALLALQKEVHENAAAAALSGGSSSSNVSKLSSSVQSRASQGSHLSKFASQPSRQLQGLPEVSTPTAQAVPHPAPQSPAAAPARL